METTPYAPYAYAQLFEMLFAGAKVRRKDVGCKKVFEIDPQTKWTIEKGFEWTKLKKFQERKKIVDICFWHETITLDSLSQG